MGGSRRDDSTTRAELGRTASKRSSCASASADLSSWRSSTISTTGSSRSANSERTMSTNWSPSTPANAARCISGSIDAAGLRSASRTADQNRCASCSSRSTDTNATRPTSVERSAHVRNSEVFPLPAGAEMTVIRLVTARSSVWRSGAVQRLEERFPVQQATSDRNIFRDRLIQVAFAPRRPRADHAVPTVSSLR